MNNNHRIHNKATIFLMEILMNIFFFSILMCVALKFFVTAHTTTQTTIDLEHAVTWCENMASICKNSDGTLEELQVLYPEAIVLEDQAILYLDSDFNVVTSDNAYQITINLLEDEEERQTEIKIRFVDAYGNDIYVLKTYAYHPLSPSGEGGSEDES